MRLGEHARREGARRGGRLEIERQMGEEGGGWRGEGEGRREEGFGRRVRGERKREEEGGYEGERREEGGWMGRTGQEGKSANVRGSPRRGRIPQGRVGRER